jgi:hypothetical protein
MVGDLQASALDARVVVAELVEVVEMDDIDATCGVWCISKCDILTRV